MKKILSLVLVMSFLSFGACYSSYDTSSNTSRISTSSKDNATINNSNDSSSASSTELNSIVDSSSKQQVVSSEKETVSSKNENLSKNQESTSKMVYKTPTGKRYHYSLSCAGKNGKEVSLDEAKQAGLTPCQKCAK